MANEIGAGVHENAGDRTVLKNLQTGTKAQPLVRGVPGCGRERAVWCPSEELLPDRG
jgi:hypothetical protein